MPDREGEAAWAERLRKRDEARQQRLDRYNAGDASVINEMSMNELIDLAHIEIPVRPRNWLLFQALDCCKPEREIPGNAAMPLPDEVPGMPALDAISKRTRNELLREHNNFGRLSIPYVEKLLQFYGKRLAEK